MLAVLSYMWRIVLLNGVSALLFAVAVFGWRTMTASDLAFFFGIYCLINALVAIAVARGTRKRRNKLQREFLTIGIASMCAGGILLVWVSISAAWLSIIAALWAGVIGTVEIRAARKVRELVPREYLFLFVGVTSLLLDMALISIWLLASIDVADRPTALTVGLTLAMATAVRGGLLIALGIRLHGQLLVSYLSAYIRKHREPEPTSELISTSSRERAISH